MQLWTNLSVHGIAWWRYWLTHAAHTSLSGHVSSQMMLTGCKATVHSGLETALQPDSLHVPGVNVWSAGPWHTLKYDCAERLLRRDQKRLQATRRKNEWRWRVNRGEGSCNGQREMDPQISQITFACIQSVRLQTDNSCQKGTHPKCKHRWSEIITRTAGWGAGGNEMVYDGSARPLKPSPNEPPSVGMLGVKNKRKLFGLNRQAQHQGRPRNVCGTSLKAK